MEEAREAVVVAMEEVLEAKVADVNTKRS